ncbi:retrovirus-related pol polyprotein from transposon opus [Plakobranchus ocellatus]|uniref:Retrovirus-related pol polyprotein from transposon opus n=1 Tax=Plakobranchus ocellatus TaxID=259542 RepID=A0AAV4E0E0_9GAST|nr:retrovirus-related pol polyprotein from transposon opus [Plakobranchus ocellatus]
MELKRLELEAETKKLEIGSRASVDVAGPKQSYGAQRPKIPPLHDPSQVDLYLERCERHATAFGWPESEWASCLSNLLQDEALSMFLSLSPAEGSDYQAVKRVLLQRFGCDRNGFRSKFLTVKPQEAEDFGTFINRARRYFDRWVELSRVSTLEGLSYLVCSEIALQACDEDFVAYIKDRSPSDMVALKSVASAYMDARPNKSFHRKHSVSFAAKSEPYHSTVRLADRKHDSGPQGRGGRFNYSSKGHISPSFQSNSNMVKRGASHSPSRDRGKPNVANKNVGQGQFRPSSGSFSSNITCFQCGGRGHFRSECPSRPKEANFSSSVPDSPSHSCKCSSRPKEANVAFSVPELPYHCCAAKMDCSPRGGLKIEFCKVFDRVSTLLRDSGCNTVGVSKSLVPPDCYTGKSMLTTVAVPKSLRQVVLSHAHESVSAGHSGFRKTLSSIRDCFSWPGVCSDVRNYITSCRLCKSRPRTGRDRPAPFQHNQIRQSWRTPQRSVCDSAEPTAYVSAISEEDGGEIGSLVTTPPLASENGAVVIDQSLSASQVQDVKELLLEFQDILTSVPGCTNTICHEIRLTTDDVIRVKPYPLPFAARDFVTQEVKDLLSLGVIEPSDSPYCFPIVVAKKKDGSMRLCIDFRKLNALTVFDAENIARQEDLFNQLSHATISSQVVIYAKPKGRFLCTQTVVSTLLFRHHWG